MGDIRDIDAAQTVKITGSDPDGTEISPVKSKAGNLFTQDGPSGQLDATGRKRVSEPTILFNAYYVQTDRSFLFDEAITGSASISRNTNESSMQLSTTAASGDRAIRQSFRYFAYIPGLSYIITFTGKFGQLKANCLQKMGYFDDNNGLFFEATGTVINVVRRTSTSGSPVDTKIPQSSWNYDKFDGTGPSKITLDFTKQQFFVIDFQWQGSGQVRWGFHIDGEFLPAHIESYSNNLTTPYMRTATLPVRLEIQNIGATSGTTTMNNTCISVISEGEVLSRSVDDVGVVRDTPKSIGTSGYTPILGLRLNPATPRGSIDIREISTLLQTNDDVAIQVVLAPTTVTGASWVNTSGAISQFDISATAITGGKILKTYLLSKSQSIESVFESVLKLGSSIAGVPQALYITGRSLSSPAGVYTSINFSEEF